MAAFRTRIALLLVATGTAAIAACSGDSSTTGAGDAGGKDASLDAPSSNDATSEASPAETGGPGDGAPDTGSAGDAANPGDAHGDAPGADAAAEAEAGAPVEAGTEAAAEAGAEAAADGGADAGAEAEAGSTLGCFDPSFGTGGLVVLPDPPNASDSANMVIQPADAKIILSGQNAANGLTVARYGADGSVDTTWGTQGFVTLPPVSPATQSYPAGIALQPDGKVVVAMEEVDASSDGSSTVNLVVTRLGANGALDTTFGGAGSFVGAPGFGARAMALRPDGRIVVAGYEYVASADEFAVAQLGSNGALDTTFGTGGIVHMVVGTPGDAATVLVQPDGKLLVGGWTLQTYDGGANSGAAIARFNTDGTLDATFGTGGAARHSFGPAQSAVIQTVLQSTGRIVAVVRLTAAAQRFVLLGYTSAGVLDATFGAGGITSTDFFGWDAPTGVVLLSGDRLVVAGNALGSDAGTAQVPAFARYTSAGALDTTFGAGGALFQPNPGQKGFTGRAIALDPLGRVVLSGNGYTGTPNFLDLVRVGCL